MKSGLYVLPGASATACAAAAASSFDFPITNVWNVYRSLSGVVGAPDLSMVAGSRGATKKSICGRCWRSSCTRNTTAVGRPNTRSAARASTLACFCSFHSTANWSGAPTIRRSSSSAIGTAGSSHVRTVASGSSRRASSSSRRQASLVDCSIHDDEEVGRPARAARKYGSYVEKSTLTGRATAVYVSPPHEGNLWVRHIGRAIGGASTSTASAHG